MNNFCIFISINQGILVIMQFCLQEKVNTLKVFWDEQSCIPTVEYDRLLLILCSLSKTFNKVMIQCHLELDIYM